MHFLQFSVCVELNGEIYETSLNLHGDCLVVL